MQHLAHIKTISAQLKRIKKPSKKKKKTKCKEEEKKPIMITRVKHEIVFNKLYRQQLNWTTDSLFSQSGVEF